MYTKKEIEQRVAKGLSCTDMDLRGINFDCANLAGGNFSRANFMGCSMRGVNLAGANLSGANLSYANLSPFPTSGEK